MISGTIKNAVRLEALNNKWEQKKNSGDVLSKKERNERANWTAEQRQAKQYQEQLEKGREGNKRVEIANKISAGHKLTPEEEKYMATYDPQGLADYKQTQNERKAYEEKLKKCKTKEEVQKLKSTTLGNHLSSLKKIVNNPNIPLSEKLKKAQQMLGRTNNIQDAEEEFIEEGKYGKLPTEAELAEERMEAVESEELSAEIDLTNQKPVEEIENDAASEIEDIYKHLAISKQLEDGTNKDVEAPEEKLLGKKMDFSV